MDRFNLENQWKLKFLVCSFLVLLVSCEQRNQDSKTREVPMSTIHFNVMAPLHVMYFNDPKKLEDTDWELFGRQLDMGAEMGIDAVSVDVWWGFAEGKGNNQFDWEYYHRIFNEITDRGIDLIPILSFHAFDPGPDRPFRAPLPPWIWEQLVEDSGNTLSEIDLKYVSEDLGENGEALYSNDFVSLWAHQLVMPQYREFMDAFILEFEPFLDRMQEINVSCGPSGELRFPSYSRHDSGSFPNRGRFQCYSRPAQQDYRNWLKNQYESIEELNNAWTRNYSNYEKVEMPRDLDTLFKAGTFREEQRVLDLITWYNEALMQHGNRMLNEALDAFADYEDIQIGFKIPGIHWRIGDPIMPRSAEIACGLITTETLDGSAAYENSLAMVYQGLPKQTVTLHFTCIEQDNAYYGEGPSEHYSQARDLVFEVGAAANRLGIKLKGENASARGLYEDGGWDRMGNTIWDGNYIGVTILRLGDVTTENELGNQRYAQLIEELRDQPGPIDDTQENLYPPTDFVFAKHNDWTRNHYRERIIDFKREPLKTGDIVFLGNSITEGGKDWNRFFDRDNVKNRGIAGDITEGALNRLKEVYHYKPAAVFILMGINDLWNDAVTEEDLAANILEIIQTLNEKSPETKVYVQTILPTANETKIASIAAVNEELKNNLNQARYEIIDLHALFADENDLMKEELSYDGTHLNDEGYEVWVNHVKPYVEQ